MFDAQRSKRPEQDRSQAEPALETSRTKQSTRHTEDLTRIPVYTQLAWGNQPPPWLRLPVQRQVAHEEELLQDRNEPLTQRKENTTGLPDMLKAGVEDLSSVSMDDVHVHYHSSKPAEVQALAYTQGTDIHVGPGQEQHLPHEAWHVVQQKQGRVKPTLQAKGVAMNDDQELEREADRMGKLARQESGDGASTAVQRQEKMEASGEASPDQIQHIVHGSNASVIQCTLEMAERYSPPENKVFVPLFKEQHIRTGANFNIPTAIQVHESRGGSILPRSTIIDLSDEKALLAVSVALFELDNANQLTPKIEFTTDDEYPFITTIWDTALQTPQFFQQENGRLTLSMVRNNRDGYYQIFHLEGLS